MAELAAVGKDGQCVTESFWDADKPEPLQIFYTVASDWNGATLAVALHVEFAV